MREVQGGTEAAVADRGRGGMAARELWARGDKDDQPGGLSGSARLLAKTRLSVHSPRVVNLTSRPQCGLGRRPDLAGLACPG